MKKKIKITLKYTKNELNYYNKLSLAEQKYIKLNELSIYKYNNNNNIPLRFKIFNLPISTNNKIHIINKYNIFNTLDTSDTEYHKYINYFNTLENIPFNKYHKINYDKYKNVNDYLLHSKNILNNVMYGNSNVKNHIIELLGIFYTNKKTTPTVFGIQGPKGVGKTTLIRDGFSKCLDNRPLEIINLSGMSDSSYFKGHSFTYEGSKYGKFVEILMKYQIMNPIIYFDELDKLSNTDKGKEIMDLLIYITDPTLNNKFLDEYISNIDIDLSKCIFVFTYNNPENICPILLDRITELNISDYTPPQKYVICNNYILSNIYSNIGINTSKFILHKNIVKYIYNKYANNSIGLRTIKKMLYILFTKINMLIITNFNWELLNIKNCKYKKKFPINVDINLVNLLLK